MSSISNYHWWQYVRCDGTKSSGGIHVRLTDYLLYHPLCEGKDDILKLNHIPESPRNRLMYNSYTDESAALKSSVAQLLKLDKSEENAIDDDDCHQQENKSNKCRRYATQVLKVLPETICDKMGMNLTTVKNSTERNRNLCSTFSQQLIIDGTIQWCKHSQCEDTVIMSDYSPSTGDLSPLSFFHDTCITSERTNDHVLVKCTYHIYNTIQCAGLSGIDLCEGEDVALGQSITCIHCRFFMDYLMKYRGNIHGITSSSIIDRKVKMSLSSLNNPVVVIGVARQNTTTKLSVVDEETVSMIHINFNEANSCFAKCQNGEYAVRLTNKKKIPKTVRIDQSTNLCGHIKTLLANFEIVSELFPEYFCSAEGSLNLDEEVSGINNLSANAINQDDDIIEALPHEHVGNFDFKTGCWKFSSRSMHRPKEMNDLELARLDYF